MKYYILIISFIAVIQADGQDIPLYSQKLTNSFLYNPALAGQTSGSATYTYRRNHAKVEGAPEDHFLSLHSPFSGYRFGVGLNLFQEKVNAIQNTYANAAFAYHIRNRYKAFSVGLATEFGSTAISGLSNTNPGTKDPVLSNYGGNVISFDASFGAHYQTQHAKIGFAFNKIASSWIKHETSLLANFFSAYAQGIIKIRNGHDLFEPYISVRKFSPLYTAWDLGVFYTYADKLIGGVAYRKAGAINATLGFQVTERILLAYSYEVILGDVGSVLGSTNEFTIRIDFSSYDERKRLISECITVSPYGKTKNRSQVKRVAVEKNRYLRKGQKK